MQKITFNASLVFKMMMILSVLVVLGVVAVGIFYEIHSNKIQNDWAKATQFQQHMHMWVGNTGIIILGLVLLAVIFLFLVMLSVRDYLPLLMMELRLWGHFKRIKLGEMASSWNHVITQPQFASVLGVANELLKSSQT